MSRRPLADFDKDPSQLPEESEYILKSGHQKMTILPDFMKFNKTPATLGAALDELRDNIQKIDHRTTAPADFLVGAASPVLTDFLAMEASVTPVDFLAVEAAAVPDDFLAWKADATAYLPANFLAWGVGVSTTTEALDILREDVDDRAVKTSDIATADVTAAEASYSQAQMDLVIDLLNEVKATLNTMNA